ncbi:molecular chaperone [Paracoccus sp. p4-l81]|uniref:TorD/DmsD family molecular chaperone n=1 Tax=Paracoccus sp. p4-l81 TaxID=3342806 RepID=UPI0035B9256E
MAEAMPTELPAGGAEALAAGAEALAILIRLHDREVDQDLIDALRQMDAGGLFQAMLTGQDGNLAARAFAEALAMLPDRLDDATLDQLAVDFADIYLNHGLRISPNGSVWLTEDQLERQLPMFEVREWYDHYGVSVPNWRIRSDDHIVHELEFVAHLLRQGTAPAAVDAGRFLDRHVLPWVPEFGRRVAKRAAQPLTATTGLLTAMYLDALREMIAAITGVPRGPVEQRPDEKPVRQAEPLENAAYVPGMSVSW